MKRFALMVMVLAILGTLVAAAWADPNPGGPRPMTVTDPS